MVLVMDTHCTFSTFTLTHILNYLDYIRSCLQLGFKFQNSNPLYFPIGLTLNIYAKLKCTPTGIPLLRYYLILRSCV